MAAIIKFKRSKTAGSEPTANQLVEGEVALNLVDRKLYSRIDDGSGNGTIVKIGGDVFHFGMGNAAQLGSPTTKNIPTSATTTSGQTAATTGSTSAVTTEGYISVASNETGFESATSIIPTIALENSGNTGVELSLIHI